MAISPWPSGQTQPLTLTLAVLGGGKPQLSGATLTLRIHNLDVAGVPDIIGDGQFTSIDTITGIVTYQWGTSEPVSVPGTYDIYVDAVYSNPTFKRIFGPTRWVVTVN